MPHIMITLQACIDSGADLSSFLIAFEEVDSVYVISRNTGIEDFSLIYVAAANGHTLVVKRLTEHNVSFTDASKFYPTPLHLAAGNGHLDVVKLFYV